MYFRQHFSSLRHPPGSFSTFARFAFVAGLITFGATGFLLSQHSPDDVRYVVSEVPHPLTDADAEVQAASAAYDDLVADIPDARLHPIDRLIAASRKTQDALLAKRSGDIATAAAKYRTRRGRHPPPGFDKWVEYAIKHDAIIVEDFFDRIYHDLSPYWALDPQTLTTRAESWHHVVRVRRGEAKAVGDVKGRVPWLELWTNLVAQAAPFLPDVDMPINYMDEPRLLVPWKDVTRYVAEEKGHRTMTPVEETVTVYKGLAAIDDAGRNNGTQPYEPAWINNPPPQYWDLARIACSPDSPSRHNMAALTDVSSPPNIPFDWKPAFASDGFIMNSTAAADPCTQPHLRALHGTFIEPLSIASTSELIPLFSGCKLPMNNDILIPGAMYLTTDPFYSGGSEHGPAWASKTTSVIWRGVASGGRNKRGNWRRFQRHRLVEMLNGTTVTDVEHNGVRAMTFDFAPVSKYNFARRRDGRIGGLLSRIADAGFTDLLCFPRDQCDYVTPHFQTVPSKPMAEQYKHKFIPDVDGNSFSARFRGLLLSTSLPLKATIYAEWHDDRLQPWLHYAALDNTFQDLYAVLDYFISSAKGDAAARLLASSGKRWGEQVLRHDDMLLYVWRLLLEFARICDEDRDKLGYVGDLAPKITSETQ